jgi:hypothetical protein
MATSSHKIIPDTHRIGVQVDLMAGLDAVQKGTSLTLSGIDFRFPGFPTRSIAITLIEPYRPP